MREKERKKRSIKNIYTYSKQEEAKREEEIAYNMAINNNNSTTRSQLQAIVNNPYAIRQEIQRFESVHPSIYAVYDLIELIPDLQIATQIREHIVNIEG